MKQSARVVLFLFFIFSGMSLPSETLVDVQDAGYAIPKHIKYIPASKKVNDEAVKALRFLCSDKPYKKTEVPEVIMIGPRLWDAVKDLAPISGKPSIPATIVVPAGGEMKKLNAGVVRSKERTYNFLYAFKNIIHNSRKVVIRKANENELSYYWMIIGYDIEEPVYVIECEDADKYLVDFGEDAEFFYIENVCGI